MRMILNITMPHDEFNDAVRDGVAGETLSRLLEDIDPEAAYFTECDGQRAAILIVNVEDAAQIPALTEPWFLAFNADVRVQVCLSQEDLQRANVDEIGEAWT